LKIVQTEDCCKYCLFIIFLFTSDKLVIHELGAKSKNEIRLIKEINDTRINCADFSFELNKLVYGCSNGLLKVKFALKLDNTILNSNYKKSF
jgi:hypothetical protein